eukprot:4900292-Alexandrium_andersonii.AAC.1
MRAKPPTGPFHYGPHMSGMSGPMLLPQLQADCVCFNFNLNLCRTRNAIMGHAWHNAAGSDAMAVKTRMCLLSKCVSGSSRHGLIVAKAVDAWAPGCCAVREALAVMPPSGHQGPNSRATEPEQWHDANATRNATPI